MKRIGIVAALRGELRPLVRGWSRRGHVFAGRMGELETVAAYAGMGETAVTRACEEVLAEGEIQALVSLGWAGSLSCGLRPPEAVGVREVIDAGSGERFATDNSAGQRLITVDHVAGIQEKRRLAESYQAVLVDMEASTVARMARAKGLQFFCFKGVSDGPGEKLPDFNRFTGADGQLRMGKFAAYAVLHPQIWASLGRLEKNSRQAAEELTVLFNRCMREWQ